MKVDQRRLGRRLRFVTWVICAVCVLYLFAL